jgi:two-component system invasion response regulator UvrY
MTRILIADDHPVVRHGIRQIVSTGGDMQVVDEASNREELLERARRIQHDLVLLDLTMPDVTGLDLLKELKRERPTVPVVVLTMHSERQLAVRAMKAGAAGFLTKDSAATELVTAVRRVVGGGRYISVSVAETLAWHLVGDGERLPHERLSDREYEVLLLIAAGRSTQSIAAGLALSVKTIGTYRARIFEKMQVKSPAELAAYVVRNRLDD